MKLAPGMRFHQKCGRSLELLSPITAEEKESDRYTWPAWTPLGYWVGTDKGLEFRV